jgi:hypothetical protein
MDPLWAIRSSSTSTLSSGRLDCPEQPQWWEGTLVEAADLRWRLIVRTKGAGPQAEDQCLWNDLQECDLPAFKAKEEPQIDWAARKVAGQPACDDRCPVTLLQGKRFACIGVFGRGFGLPLLDGYHTRVGVAFILHHGVVRETLCDGLDVSFVGGEIGGDRFGKVESFGHDGPHQFVMSQNDASGPIR